MQSSSMPEQVKKKRVRPLATRFKIFAYSTRNHVALFEPNQIHFKYAELHQIPSEWDILTLINPGFNEIRLFCAMNKDQIEMLAQNIPPSVSTISLSKTLKDTPLYNQMKINIQNLDRFASGQWREKRGVCSISTDKIALTEKEVSKKKRVSKEKSVSRPEGALRTNFRIFASADEKTIQRFHIKQWESKYTHVEIHGFPKDISILKGLPEKFKEIRICRPLTEWQISLLGQHLPPTISCISLSTKLSHTESTEEMKKNILCT